MEFKKVSANEAERVAKEMGMVMLIGPDAPSECPTHEDQCPPSCHWAKWEFVDGCDNGLIGEDFRWLHCPVCGSEDLQTIQHSANHSYIGCACGWGEP